jgi:uncharacterized protein YidB (DUF937 family)
VAEHVTTMAGRIAAGLDRMLDSQGADGIALAVAKFLPGGLPALLDALREAGHGEAVASWLGAGPNAPVPAEALARVLPPESERAIAQDLGVRPERLPVALAQFLPVAVDRESPDGALRAQPRFDARAILDARSASRRVSR